jgi:hypothetical protein
MSCGFHQAYCKPCQKSRACRMRRISCRRATMPSSRYCTTSSRSAFTRSGRNSSSCSLFAPRESFASASCAVAAGCLPSIPSGAREAPAPCPAAADEPSSGAANPSFGASLSPFKMARSFKLFIELVMFFSRTGFSLSLFHQLSSNTSVEQPTRLPRIPKISKKFARKRQISTSLSPPLLRTFNPEPQSACTDAY